MKTKHVILMVVFAATSTFCSAQDQTESKTVQPVQFAIAQNSPYYVLKAGEKSVGISPGEDQKFYPSSINPDGIKEIQVLKGDDAIAKYGDNGTHGVVIIIFKESYILPKDLQARFDEVK